VVDELRLASPGRVIEADFAIDRPVNCDRVRIGQPLSNLLGNALTHGASDEPVVVHAETRNGSLELWVANVGEPIPPASIKKLFEPFFRIGMPVGHRSTNHLRCWTRRFGGLLENSLAVVRVHRGVAVTVENDGRYGRSTIRNRFGPASLPHGDERGGKIAGGPAGET
jgi:light-regulated signal transduction histidine kinase (bacteriophytochrome)